MGKFLYFIFTKSDYILLLIFIKCFNSQEKEKASLDIKNSVSPDNKSTSSSKGPSFMQSNEKKLAMKRASSKSFENFKPFLCNFKGLFNGRMQRTMPQVVKFLFIPWLILPLSKLFEVIMNTTLQS
jgi:hypothetical protein